MFKLPEKKVKESEAPKFTTRTIFDLYSVPNVEKIDGPPEGNWMRQAIFGAQEYFDALRYLKIAPRPSKTIKRRLHYWREGDKSYIGLYSLEEAKPSEANT